MTGASSYCHRLLLASLLLSTIWVRNAGAEAPDSLDQLVARSVAQNYPSLLRCFRQLLAVDRTRQGTLFLLLTLGTGDAITGVAVERDELGDDAVARCVMDSVRRWRLAGAGAAGAQAGEQILLPLTLAADPGQQAVQRDDAATLIRGSGSTLQPLLTEKNAGALQASLSLIKLQQGRLSLPARADAAQALYVLAGRGLLRNSAKEGKWRLTAGSAVWLPAGGRFSLAGELELLWLIAPAGPEQEQEQATASATGSEAQLGKPRVVRRQEVRPRRRAAGLTCWPLLNEQRTHQARLYLGVLQAAPRARLAAYSHAGSAELVYVLSGSGSLQLGDRVIELRPGLALYLPAGWRHKLQVTTKLQAVQVFAPAGSEAGAPAAPLEATP